MKNKRIVVTGGAGFIGSHLCEALIKDNEVISIDNYFTGSTRNHINDVAYIYADAKNISDVVSGNVDIIYHLGEYSRVEQSFDDFNLVMEYNTHSLCRILEFAKNKNSKLIYAGSSTKYGDNGKNSSPYAWSKSTNTDLVKNYANWFGLNFAISYFYNVYGGREIKSGKYATLIAKFTEMYKKGENLTIVSPGTQTRNFTYIDDTISALLLIGEYGQGDGYGIAAEESYSILQLAEMFGLEYTMLPERKGNRLTAGVFNDKIKELGWKQSMVLSDYIDRIKTH